MAEAIGILTGEEQGEQFDADQSAERDMQLAGLAGMCSDLRREAIDGRRQSGIEVIWLEDEEFYEGIDDANRHEHGAYYQKPPYGVISSGTTRRDETSSTIFPNITRPYCDAAAARVGDMLLPTDDRAWQIKPTPVPELVDMAQAMLSDSEIEELRDQVKEQLAGQGDDKAIDEQLEQLLAEKIRSRFPRHIRKEVDAEAEREYGGRTDFTAQSNRLYTRLAESVADDLEAAKRAAKKAETRIDDWHVEGQYHAEMRKVIDSTTRIGTGVLKGPIPYFKKHTAYKNQAIVVEEKLAPQSCWVNVWNCYPDPGCGESIHNGGYHWERDDIPYRKLAELRGQPGYLDDQINAVLDEGAHTACKEVKEGDPSEGMIGLAERKDRKHLFEIWYGYLDLTTERLMAAGIDVPEEMGEHPVIPVAVTMVNNRIIRVSPNHLSNGEFPYDYMVWQRRANSPFGTGVARQIRVAQRIVTAAARNMMDNAGLAGGPMFIYLNGLVHPMDGKVELRPRKAWYGNLDKAADPRLAQYAFQFIDVPMYQVELERIIMFGLKMAEDVTGLPQLMQGHTGSAPDTASGMALVNNNASTVLRRVARLFDDCITEPHVRRYYTYLLQYGEDDEEKGEFVIDARGSSALVERELNNIAIQQALQVAANPIYGLDPKKTMEEYLKSQHLDVQRFQFEDDEWEKVVTQLAQSASGGSDDAKIRAGAQIQVQELKNQNADMDRELKKAELAMQREREIAEAAGEEFDRQMQQAFKALDYELEQAKVQGGQSIDIEKIMQRYDEIKSDIARDVMKLRAQFQMQDRNDAAAELTEPPVEPTGRAPDGQAFQR